MFNRLYRLFLLLSIPVFLSACASVPQASVENLEGPIPSNTGIVIAETLTNSGRITGQINIWDQLIIWRIESEEEKTQAEQKNSRVKKPESTFSIKALNRNSDYQQYMGLIPEGHYHIGLLWAYLRRGDISYWAKAYVPPVIGTFHVKAGEVTDLGTILYHPFQSRSATSTQLPDYAVSRVANPDLWPSIKIDQKVIVDKVNPQVVNTWDDDAFTQPRQQSYELIVKSASAKAIHRIGKQLITTGRLGLIKSAQGWRGAFTKSVIHDLIPLDDNTWVAGGEFGALALMSPEGKILENLDILDSREHVYNLAKIDNSRFFMIALKENAFQFYIYDLTTKQVEKIGKHERKSNFLFSLVEFPAVLVEGEKIHVYIDAKEHVYQLATKTWTQNKFKKIDTLHEQPNGLILATPFNGWSGIEPIIYSDNQGKTWRSYKKAAYTSTYRFLSGESLKTDESSEYSFWTGTSTDLDSVPVLSSKNDGLTWQRVGGLPIACKNIAVAASVDDEVVSLCEDGAVMVSNDKGVTWREVQGATSQPFEAFPNRLKVKYAAKP